MAYVALPAFRAPTGIDFSGLNAGLDDLAQTLEKNRLLREAKAVGASLAVTPQQAGAPAENPLLRSMPAQPVASGLATNAADFLKREEGYAPQAKWDVRQHSGGYGSSAAPGETFTPQKAETYLRRDMAPAEAWINRNVPNATPEQRTALTSFGYNLGTDDLDRLLPDIRSGDWGRVAARMQTFNKARTGPGGALQELPGLTARRQREAALVAGQGAPAQPAGPNYRAAANVAFSQGNIALGTQLLQQQQELDNQAYTRGRQTQMDARQQQQWEASHGLQEAQNRRAEASAGREAETFDDAKEKAALGRLGAISSTIAAEPDPANRKLLWDKLVASNPRWAPFLQQNRIDPGDAENGAKFLISIAQGASGKKYGTTLSYDSAGNAFVMGEDGTPKIVASPGGGAVLPRGVQMVDQGTQVTPTLGGRPLAAPLPRDVAGKERQEAIGKGEGERVIAKPQAQLTAETAIANLDGLKQEVARLKGMAGLPAATGNLQSRLPNVWQSTADADSSIENIKGRVATTALQAMRDASKTGGAVGSVTEKEWPIIESMIANLDRRQGDKTFTDRLTDIENYVEAAKARISGAYQQTYGSAAPVVAPSPSNPQIDALKQKYRLE